MDSTVVIRWRRKLEGAERGFGPGSGTHAARIFDLLVDSPSHSLEAANIAALASATGLRSKFVPRAVAMLTRSGIVTADLSSAVRLKLHPELLERKKNSAQSTRRGLNSAEREHVLRESRYRCGHCERKLRSDDLRVDHLIPVNALGVDELANWVCLCKAHNRSKWDTFDRTFLKWYRGEKIERPIGIRFRNGFFWPVINGRIRLDRRDAIGKGAA